MPVLDINAYQQPLHVIKSRPAYDLLQQRFSSVHRVGLTNVGALFGKIAGAYLQDQNERPNDRVLFNVCRTIKT